MIYGAESYYSADDSSFQIYNKAGLKHNHPRSSKCTKKHIPALKGCIGFFKAIQCEDRGDQAAVSGSIAEDEATLERLEKKKCCIIL